MADGSMILTQMCAARWAMHRPTLSAAVSILERRTRGERLGADDVAAIMAGREARQEARKSIGGWDDDARASEIEQRGYFVDGGVAVMPVQGLICKYASMINGISQPQGMTTASICRTLEAAAGEVRPGGRVQSILVDIDSPGGTLAGIHDVQATIAEVRSRGVRIVAFCHDMAASGAYWLASQCNSVYCTPQADVGSIGVYTVLEDSSAMLAESGIKRYLIASGEHKGTGADGVEVTESQLIQASAEINAANSVFIAAVAAGRGMDVEAVRGLASGRVFIGQQAVEAGLCDGATGYSELLAMMNEHAAAA